MDSLGNEKVTLKANELRIGNIVSTDGRCRDIDILILSENDFGNLIIFKTWSRIHPIPITEEWLIRLGFKKHGQVYENGHYWFHLRDNTLQINPRIEFSGTWANQCDYVHQLQNIYFVLEGKELEVKESARP